MGWIGAATGARGQIITQPDPPAGTFGPTDPQSSGTLAARVQAVKDATIPLAVTHPGGSPTVVNPGDDIATKITVAGAGGTLWFVKGNHTLSSPVAVLGGQTWVLESAAGYTRTSSDSAIIDGGATSSAQGAWVNVANVTIRGGVWQNQGNASAPVGAAPIQSTTSATNLTVEDAILKDNYQVALSTGGSNFVGRRLYITNNGRLGFGCGAGTGVLDACRMSFNNTRNLDPGASGSEAGTMKFAGTANTWTIKRSWIHDNTGFGLWVDFGDGTHVWQDNVCEHNALSGLFMESVEGGCKLLRNYALNNGYDITSVWPSIPAVHWTSRAQMRITGSDATTGSGVRGDVSKNVFDYTLTVSDHAGAHFLLWDHVGPRPDTKNWDVHENQWWMRDATFDNRLGGFDNDESETSQLWNNGNSFYDNEYHVASTTNAYWNWDSGTGDGVPKTYTQWQAFHPGDDIPLALI